MILHQQIANEQPLFEVAIFICSPIPFSESLEHGIDTRKYFGLKTDVPSRPNAISEIPDYLITHKAYLNGEEEDDVESEDGDSVDEELMIKATRYERPQLGKFKETEVIVKEIALDNDDEDGNDSYTPASSVSDSDNDTRFSSLDTSLSNSVVFTSRSKLEKPSTFYQMFFPTVDSMRINIPTAHIYGREDSWRRHSMCLVDLCEQHNAGVYQHQGGHAVPGAAAIEDVEGMCDVIESAFASVGV